MIWLWSLAADEWVFAIFGLGVCLMGSLLIKGLASPQKGALGFVTTVFTALPRVILNLSQKLVATFAPATFGPQQRVAAGLHDIARLTDDTAAVIEGNSAITAMLAQALTGTATTAAVAATAAGLTKRVGNAETQARGIGADVLPQIKAAVHGIDAVVSPRLATLDKEIARIDGQALPRVNGRVTTAQNEITSLREWVHRHLLRAGTLAFAGAVAYALAQLGMGWLKCNSVSRLGRRLGCRGFGLLDDLLFGAIDVLVIADLCRITSVMIDVAESSVVQDALGGIIGGIDDLLRCQGVTRPDVLDGYWADPPPLQKFAALPGV